MDTNTGPCSAASAVGYGVGKIVVIPIALLLCIYGWFSFRSRFGFCFYSRFCFLLVFSFSRAGHFFLAVCCLAGFRCAACSIIRSIGCRIFQPVLGLFPFCIAVHESHRRIVIGVRQIISHALCSAYKVAPVCVARFKRAILRIYPDGECIFICLFESREHIFVNNSSINRVHVKSARFGVYGQFLDFFGSPLIKVAKVKLHGAFNQLILLFQCFISGSDHTGNINIVAEHFCSLLIIRVNTMETVLKVGFSFGNFLHHLSGWFIVDGFFSLRLYVLFTLFTRIPGFVSLNWFATLRRNLIFSGVMSFTCVTVFTFWLLSLFRFGVDILIPRLTIALLR